jgi:hypothetical protein
MRLQSTDPIKSSRATIQDRKVESKCCLSNTTGFAMISKLAPAAEQNCRRLDGVPTVIPGSEVRGWH